MTPFTFPSNHEEIKMVLTRKAAFVIGLLTILMVVMVGTVSPIIADEEKPTIDPLQTQIAEATSDPFTVPNGTPDELFEYLNNLAKLRPTGTDQTSIDKFRRQQANSFLQAVDKIIESPKTTEKQIAEVVYMEMTGISLLRQAGKIKKSKKILSEFPEQLKKHNHPKAARNFKAKILTRELADAMFSASRAQKNIEEVLKDIDAFVDEKLDQTAADLVTDVISSLQIIYQYDMVLGICDKYGKLFIESKDPHIVLQGKLLQGTARRLRSIGKPMKLVGKTVDGSDFKWNTYKGKVVVVMFWWNSMCVYSHEELMNLLRLYNKYHDKGLEVVVVSMGQDFNALKQYLKKNSMPWTFIYNGSRKPDEKSIELPNITYYGITHPQWFIVGRDGNVTYFTRSNNMVKRELRETFEPEKEKE